MKKNSFYILILLLVLVFNVSYGQPTVTTPMNALGPGTYTSSLDPEKAIQLHWGSFKKKNEGLQSYIWNKKEKQYYASPDWSSNNNSNSDAVPQPVGIVAEIIDPLLPASDVSLRAYILDITDPNNPIIGKKIFTIFYNKLVKNRSKPSEILECINPQDHSNPYCGLPIDIPISPDGRIFSGISHNGARIKAIMKDLRVLSKHDQEWVGWGQRPMFAVQVVDEYQKVVVELIVGPNMWVREIAIPGISKLFLTTL